MSEETTATGKPMILGVCASLRAGRWGQGSHKLVEQIQAIPTEDGLKEFLKHETTQQLENFLDAGRRDGMPFPEQYRALRKMGGLKGLSNSEASLAASLWSAKENGCTINCVSLREYFPACGEPREAEELKRLLMEADGVILSTPVYFGDRSSLAHGLTELIRRDPELSVAMRGRVYAGVAVGAKRNGGQETTLIYEIVDMVDLGMLAVGNDSSTTSQYGGTCHAGDVGTAWKDDYGIWTCIGVGRRVARVAQLLLLAEAYRLKSKLRIGFWILQDRAGFAREQIEALAQQHADKIEAHILDATKEEVFRCLACDICPKDIDKDSVYRCVISSSSDLFKKHHTSFLDIDAIVPVALSLKDRSGLVSAYQVFTERTRYFRRGDYVFSDFAVAPFLFEEVGSHESLRIRILTSMIRHHTVMTRPIVCHLHGGRILNPEQVHSDWQEFVDHARRLTIGRLVDSLRGEASTQYNPVGYVLSALKDKEDQKLEKRRAFCVDRNERLQNMAHERLAMA